MSEAKMASRLFLLPALLCPTFALGQSLPQPQVRMQPENDNSNRAASTSYVDRSVRTLLDALAGKASLANPHFSGTVKADTLQILGSGSTGDASTFTVPSAGLGLNTTLSALLSAAQPRVATNPDLKAVLLPYSRIRRDGFYAAGDGGAMDYTWSASNCAKADDGAQVQPTGRTGCWIADPSAPAYFETWGARGSGNSDDGPAIRAACAWGAASGKPIRVRQKQYALNSLDPSGLGAIVLGGATTGNNAPSCDLQGEGTSLLPDNVYIYGPVLILGNGLNRPLVYAHPNTRSPTWTGVALSGNRAGQTGWPCKDANGADITPCGPSSLLFTVQLADIASGGNVESGFRMDGVVMRDGYNGNLYLGTGRGSLWLKDSWSVYSGKTVTDQSIMLVGYDATLIHMAVGSNAGRGYYVGQGSQYQILGGATYLNGGEGLILNGGQVEHFMVSSHNFQANGREGVWSTGVGPYPNSQGAIHAFSNVVFEGNSTSASGTYSDVKVDGNALVTLTSVGFPGRINTTGMFAGLPKYNIETSGTARVAVAGISVGSAGGVGTSNTAGFTNNCSALTGDVPVTCTWTPTLKGDATAGAPTYARRFGSYSRTGNTITATFNIDVTSLGGMTGNALIDGLPRFSVSGSTDFGSCTLNSWSGWTAAGKTGLGAFVSPNSSVIALITNSASGGTSDQAAVTQFGASTRLWGTCTYRVAG